MRGSDWGRTRVEELRVRAKTSRNMWSRFGIKRDAELSLCHDLKKS